VRRLERSARWGPTPRNVPPELKTDRLVLRPTSLADVAVLLDLWNESGINRHLFDGNAVLHSDVEQILELVTSAGSPATGSWLVLLRVESTVVGSAALMPVTHAALLEPRLRDHVEPAIAIREPFWGQGFGTETLRVLIAHAFTTGGLHSLAAAVDLANESSLKLVRSAGFDELSRVQGMAGPLVTFLLHRRNPSQGSFAHTVNLCSR
jgi:RimJ/RimL family protein N-acetyltransferase